MSEQPPPSSQQSPGRGGFLAFWTTLPGILTGLAALITAGVAVFSVWHGLNAGSPAAATRAGTGESVGAAATAPAQPASSGPIGILRQGQMSLDCGSSASLERGQYGPAIQNPDFFYVGPDCADAGELAMSRGHIAKVQEPADRAACVAALTASPNGYLTVRSLSEGSSVCLETDGGHVAAMRIVGLPAPGSMQVAFTYTVWG